MCQSFWPLIILIITTFRAILFYLIPCFFGVIFFTRCRPKPVIVLEKVETLNLWPKANTFQASLDPLRKLAKENHGERIGSHVFEAWCTSDYNISFFGLEKVQHQALQDISYLVDFDISDLLQHLLHIIGW